MNWELLAILISITWCVHKACNTIANIFSIKYTLLATSSISSNKDLMNLLKKEEK